MRRQALPDVAESTQRRAQVAVVRALRDGARLVVGSRTFRGPMMPVILADVSPDMEVVQSDIFAPLASLIVVDDLEQALTFDAMCPYALGASVFGPAAQADRVARRINAGVIVINDMIVPTADARVPFGGRAESGFGVTRGAEGLLELTRPTVLMNRGGKRRFHLEPLAAGDTALFSGYLKTRHGSGWRQRLSGGLELIRAAKAKTRSIDQK
jgi:aldehyde dehydrogenase (NAD+)